VPMARAYPPKHRPISIGMNAASLELVQSPKTYQVVALCFGTLALTLTRTSAATPALEEYRTFRSVSIDLQGRMPTRAEIAELETPGFNLEAWIDARLTRPAYAERIRRTYMDLLRLEVGPAVFFRQPSNVLRRVRVKDPQGIQTYVYFRTGQRRARVETDGEFCLAEAESGLHVPTIQEAQGIATNTDVAVWNKYTRLVTNPWWNSDAPGFALAQTMRTGANGSASTSIRVCAEEAQVDDEAPVTLSPFVGACDPLAPPNGRRTCPLTDRHLQARYRAQLRTQPNAAPISVKCDTQTGFTSSHECGCGPDLRRCLPNAGPRIEDATFRFPARSPLGTGLPLAEVDQTPSAWARAHWGEEFSHFMDDIVLGDRNFKEVLSGKQTVINGPLAQFYRDVAAGQCCNGLRFGQLAPTPLFAPSAVPATLKPHQAETWVRVNHRGPLASGFLTMPIFLTKYSSRRARASVLWNAFACKHFTAPKVSLKPSEEPDLAKREGCNACHATLEPLSAYFTRFTEAGWTYLEPELFPARASKAFFDANAELKGAKCIQNFRATGGKPATISNSACSFFYDPAFTFANTDSSGQVQSGESYLRGAYASPENADSGAAGLASYLTESPEFGSCVVDNIASSFLGRPLDEEDAALKASLTGAFTTSGFRMRALVRALLLSPTYRNANNLNSKKWREEGAP
jgi:Protein of unknown function (DUF1585)